MHIVFYTSFFKDHLPGNMPYRCKVTVDFTDFKIQKTTIFLQPPETGVSFLTSFGVLVYNTRWLFASKRDKLYGSMGHTHVENIPTSLFFVLH
jgi:hypothetical protein